MTEASASLSVPELPSLARALGSPRFTLERTPPPDDDDVSFTLTGHRARIEGGYGRGVDHVWANDARVLSRVRVSDAAAMEATLSPVGLERRLRVAEGDVIERVVVSRSDPVCFFEWVAEAPLSLTITWTVSDAGSRWRQLDRGLVLESRDSRTICALSRPPDELIVTGDLGVAARLDLSGGEAVRLVVAGVAPGDDEDRLLRIMGRPHVVVPARRAESRRRIEAGLALEAPEEGPVEALEWAKVDLAAVAPALEPDAALSDYRFRLVLASLASGDAGPARALVAGAGAATSGPAADAADQAAVARRLLLVARYLAWTGDLQTVTGGWERVRALVARLRDPEWRARAFGELRVVAEEVGDRELADRLRGPAADSSAREGPPRDGASLLRAQDAADPGGGADAGLRAAAVVESVVYGLLGAEPDAPRGRLRLRPRPPHSWPSLAVRRLRVGSAVVDLEHRLDGRRHAFTLRQVSGGSPLRVIMEPELEGGKMAAAWVDGQEAELDPVAVDGLIRVPVQLVLDHERSMEVEIEPADH